MFVELYSIFVAVPKANDTAKIYAFRKEPRNSIDVAFIGPSNFYTAFYSPKAYAEQGFTSYVLGISAMRGSLYKSAVREFERLHQPQLYVIELWGFTYKDQYDEARTQIWIDSMPWSRNKIDTINELVKDDKINYYFPLLKYHGAVDQWKECAKVFKDKIQVSLKGYSTTKNYSTAIKIYAGEKSNHKYKVPDEGMKCLRDFMKFCNDQGIENVLFVRGIEYDNYSDTPELKTAIELIEESGYDYLDMNDYYDYIGIDDNSDYFNQYHLNVYGSEKITSFLAQYIADNYNVKCDHTDKVEAEWRECANYNDLFESMKNACWVDEKSKLELYTQSDFQWCVDNFSKEK